MKCIDKELTYPHSLRMLSIKNLDFPYKKKRYCFICMHHTSLLVTGHLRMIKRTVPLFLTHGFSVISRSLSAPMVRTVVSQYGPIHFQPSRLALFYEGGNLGHLVRVG